jgi:hypothetical protein
MTEIAIKVENLSKCYQIYDKPHDRLLQMLARGRKQYFRELCALKDVPFEIEKGETVGIIGRINPHCCNSFAELLIQPAATIQTTRVAPSRLLNLKSAVEPIKIPFALSQSKGGRGFDRLTQWVGMWKPLMVRQAHHERFPHASTAFFRLKYRTACRFPAYCSETLNIQANDHETDVSLRQKQIMNANRRTFTVSKVIFQPISTRSASLKFFDSIN